MSLNELAHQVENIVEQHSRRIFLIGACLMTVLGAGYLFHSLGTTGSFSMKLAEFHFFVAFIAWCLYAFDGLVSMGVAVVYRLSDRFFKYVFLWMALGMGVLGFLLLLYWSFAPGKGVLESIGACLSGALGALVMGLMTPNRD